MQHTLVRWSFFFDFQINIVYMVNVKNDLLHNMMIVFRFSHVSNMSDAQKTEVCFPGITHITVEISRSSRSVLESIPKCLHKSPCACQILTNDIIL